MKKIEIISKDKFGQDSVKEYPCEINVKSKGKIYEYKDEYGKNKIITYKNKVIIKRVGEIKGVQNFEEDKKTIFLYQTPHTKSKFKIDTHELKLTEDNIELHYSILDMKGILINKLSVKISEVI